MRYYLNVTDIAAAIGRNPYKDPQTIADRLLNKAPRKEEAQVRSLLSAHQPEIQQLAKEKDEQKNITEKQTLLCESLQAELPVECAALVKEQMQSAVNQESGKQQEEGILNQVETVRKTKLHSRNTCMKYKTIQMDKGVSLRLGGRPDAIEYETGRIVEVKRRQKRLFQGIPAYEQVQIQLYMWLFDAQECLFTQNYFQESETTIVPYDAGFVEAVKVDLIAFMKSNGLTTTHAKPTLSMPPSSASMASPTTIASL